MKNFYLVLTVFAILLCAGCIDNGVSNQRECVSEGGRTGGIHSPHGFKPLGCCAGLNQIPATGIRMDGNCDDGVTEIYFCAKCGDGSCGKGENKCNCPGDCNNTNSKDSCVLDSDCACGVSKETGDCAFGNKAYIDSGKQCPDFCSGISGKLTIGCENDTCVQKDSGLIGGDKDEHGCLIPAGYSWCAEKQKCMRKWEENCSDEPGIGMANPAATYCIEKGGKYEIKTAADGGQYGICRSLDGRECEEWAYYRSNGSDCKPVTEYTVAEVLNQTCTIDQDCGTPMSYLLLSHCPYTSKCLEGKCTVVCPKPFTLPGKPESFCGRSTNASCKTTSDCVRGGCSSQICQGKSEEPAITTCEYRDCYNAAAYNLSCGCDEGKCRWN